MSTAAVETCDLSYLSTLENRGAPARYEVHLAALPNQDTPEEPVQLDSPGAVGELLPRIIPSLADEQAYALLLTADYKLIGWTCIGQGNRHTVTPSTQSTIRAAVAAGAQRVILVHTHPDGPATPSPADLQVTVRDALALSAADLNLVDHVVYCPATGEYCSILAEGSVDKGLGLVFEAVKVANKMIEGIYDSDNFEIHNTKED